MKKQLIRLLQPVKLSKAPSFAILFLRLVAGFAFVLHGFGKIQAPLNWMGPESPVPGVLQFLAAFSEFAGGISWIIGLLAPIAAMGLGCTMLVAVLMHKMILQDPFVNMTGGSSYEPALVYFAISVVFLFLGSGKFSLDAKIFGERS